MRTLTNSSVLYDPNCNIKVKKRNKQTNKPHSIRAENTVLLSS